MLNQLPNLVAVQLLTAGFDEWGPHVPETILLSNARGAHAGPVSEWVISSILALYRQWPALVRYQDQGIWAHRKISAETLREKNVLIIGAGPIGAAVADLVQPFGATATLVARTARKGIHGTDELSSLIKEHHVVVVAAPLTPETDRMVDSKLLTAMPDHAVLVNAGRGRIVDTNALVAELSKGRLRAALDVTDPEPLPADHPLWKCPGVIISPHMARTVPGTPQLCYEVAAEQIGMLVSGVTPSNVAPDREKVAKS
uniref:NAD(P)-dependent oxidoreductase n=1 Tax=Saccharothrix espanaensis TaxID=103731 RepID=UPI003F493418